MVDFRRPSYANYNESRSASSGKNILLLAAVFHTFHRIQAQHLFSIHVGICIVIILLKRKKHKNTGGV